MQNPATRLVEHVPGLLRVLVHVGALLAAVVVPVVFLSLSGGVSKFAPFFFGPALTFAVVFGGPLYLLLLWKQWINFVTATVAGFAAVAVPLGYMAWPAPGSGVSIDDVQTVVEGAFTPAGWAFFLAFLLRYSVFGAIGGTVFWAVLKLAGELPTEHPRARARVAAAVALSLVAASAAATIMYLPTYTADRSCHAWTMKGSLALVPSIDLDIEHDDWVALRGLLKDYADTWHLDVRDLSEERPNEVRILSIDLCDERIHVSVNEIRWARYGYQSQSGHRGIVVFVYHPVDDRAWRGLSRQLIAALRTRWPERLRFRNEAGQLQSEPPAVDADD